MAIRRLVVIVVVVLATGGVSARDGEPEARAGGSADRGASAALLLPGRTLVCKLPPRSRKLPATARHGLVGHLRQYPVVALATPRERSRARRVLAALVSAARTGDWRDLRAAARAGYGTRTAARKPGDRSVRYFHSGAAPGSARPYDLRPTPSEGPDLRERTATASRPRRRDVEHARRRGRGPTPRPDSPLALARRVQGGREARSHATRSGLCPPGSCLRQGASEMLHVWFTKDLRSAFAISAPKPELRVANDGYLPRDYCKRL